MELALAALPGVITSCLLAWVLLKALARQNDEHQAHRDEVAHAARALLEQARWHEEQTTKLCESHRREIAELNQARIEEVSSLLQRIQAPEAAVAEHATRDAAADPPPLDYEDDEALITERRRQLEGLMPGVLAPELLRMAHVPPYEPYEGDGGE